MDTMDRKQETKISNTLYFPKSIECLGVWRVPYIIHLVHELRPKVLGSLASVLLDTELICIL